MNKWVVTLGCAGLALAIATAQSNKPSAPPQSIPHFQLVSARVADANNAPIDMLFLLDTQDGCVWRYMPYQPARAGGTSEPEQFGLVPISNLYIPNVQAGLPHLSSEKCKIP